jgi:hypothetical protein
MTQETNKKGCRKTIDGLYHYDVPVYCGDIIEGNFIFCRDCKKKLEIKDIDELILLLEVNKTNKELRRFI